MPDRVENFSRQSRACRRFFLPGSGLRFMMRAAVSSRFQGLYSQGRDGLKYLKLLCLSLFVGALAQEPYVPDTGRFSHDQLAAWAAQYGTPLYVYDGDLMAKKFTKFQKAYQTHYGKTKVFYALKANTNLSVVGLLKKAGAAAECISAGEMRIAKRLGYQGEDILFTASSKSPEELAFAVENDVVVNLDSMSDLANLEAVADRLKKKVRISFRINPDVDPKTHKHIATGHKFSKFGILFENDEIIKAYSRAKQHPRLEIWGIHSHIGSQITDLEPFERNVQLVAEAVRRLKQDLGIELRFINLGGGLGIPYRDGQKRLNPMRLPEK